MESQPIEAVRNNIFGTKTIVEAADRFGVQAFVMISKDKGVNLTSVMGATKRVAKLIIQNLSKISNTKFVVVRFGNVLDMSEPIKITDMACDLIELNGLVPHKNIKIEFSSEFEGSG